MGDVNAPLVARKSGIEYGSTGPRAEFSHYLLHTDKKVCISLETT
jgi:hypothetical protein